MLEKVRKRDKTIDSYNRDRIFYSIRKAAAFIGEGLDNGELEQLITTIEEKLVKIRKRLISTSIIRSTIIEVTKNQYPMVERAYRRYGEEQEKKRRSLHVRRKKTKDSSTDKAMLVQLISKDERQPWHRGKLYEALLVDYGVTTKAASQIASSVEKKLLKSEAEIVSTSLIRALIKDELIERGITPRKDAQDVIGLPEEDIEQLLSSKVKENANTPMNSPEVMALAIVETVQKQWALQNVFSNEVTDAHMSCLIHLHDLGYPTRVYCSSHSPEYIKKYGLNLGLLNVVSKPAKHARTLTGHINTFLATMQAFYAGALGLGFLNILYAPLLEGMSPDEMKQEAQHLIFSGSQNAFSRGGQSLFLDYNIHTGVPDWMRDVPAIGAGGKYLKRTYGSFEKTAQDFAHALADVWAAGDGNGIPFSFPKFDLHCDESSFTDPEQKKVLEHACEVASKNGGVYFIFDRDAVNISMCCRLNIKVKDVSILKKPESVRFCGLQNITINLPRIALMTKNKKKFIKELDRVIDIAWKAHQEKKRFISYLMSAPDMPLWEVGKKTLDGKPYIDLNKATYIFGLIGLNEAVKVLFGQELHESEEALILGLEIVIHMKNRVDKISEKTGLHCALEESPAESAARRLALKDLRDFPEAKEIVRGDIDKEEVYYTNSVHFRPDAPVDMLERIQSQAKFHPLIEAGCITHLFVGEKLPPTSSIFALLRKVYYQTKTTQLTISPEFVVCNDCDYIELGIKDTCSKCGSNNVDGITRIVGYYSRTSGWNSSKRAELADRKKGNYHIEE